MTATLRRNPLEALSLPEILTSVIDGEWTSVNGSPTLTVEDPGTGQVIASFAEADDDLVDRAVRSAQAALRGPWGALAPAKRGKLLLTLADTLRRNLKDLAKLETVDTGKPISQAEADIDLCARYFEYYSGMADKFGGESIPQAAGGFAYTVREPVGVVAHITPWNSPLSQMIRGVAPSLCVGNTVVVKPSELTPLSSLLVARMFLEAGLPAGVCNVVCGRGPTTGHALAAHPLVGHITFTGSVVTGQTVLETASRYIVPCNLELGGKSPSIVMPDANVDAAARSAARAMIRNSGQACSATTRILAHRSIHDALVEKICNQVSNLTIGHGLDDPDLGPLASQPQKDKVLKFISEAAARGAEIVLGGAEPLQGPGHFVTPTVLTGVLNSMPVAREEIFGPVQSIIVFDDEDEAVALANDSMYGLAAGVFTRDISTALRLAGRLKAGQIRINNYNIGGIETPFGGYKLSGMGREKGIEALRYYTQLKTVIVDLR